MEADCFSGSFWKMLYLDMRFRKLPHESLHELSFGKPVNSMTRSIILRADARRLLCFTAMIGSNVHQDTKIRLLWNDTFRSTTTFIGNDCRFDVSFNKVDSRWKQTIFLIVVWKKSHRDIIFGSYRA